MFSRKITETDHFLEMPLSSQSGVVVIRHWRIHNYIQADRFQATIYQDEKEQLDFDKSKIASIKPLDQCIQNVSKMDTQVRLGEDRLDKDRLDKVNNLYSGEDEKKSLSQIIKSSTVKINDRQIQQIQEYIGLDNMTVDMIEYAIQLTEDAGAESFNYLNKILKSWKDKGLTSLDEAKAETSGFRDSKNVTSTSRRVGNSIIQMYEGELPF